MRSCCEIHVDLTPQGDTKGALVNKGSAECIEIWNLVFIQFNANPDGTFSPLPAKHVDTGMGFERVTSIIQSTKDFTDFNAQDLELRNRYFPSDLRQARKAERQKIRLALCRQSGSTGDTEQEKIDVAFRVIADHIRTLSFAIADGIQPGNNDATTCCAAFCAAPCVTGARSGFTNRSSTNWWTCWPKRWAMSFPRFAQTGTALKK